MDKDVPCILRIIAKKKKKKEISQMLNNRRVDKLNKTHPDKEIFKKSLKSIFANNYIIHGKLLQI